MPTNTKQLTDDLQNKESSVGYVTTKTFSYSDKSSPLVLESGEKLHTFDIAYETYGEPNKDKSNAILIVHALSGDAHAAGYHKGDTKPGWWDNTIGPGKAFDTNKYWVICSNVIGGCKGSTGPSSINPDTGKPYGLSFPVVTISDMVAAQEKLVDYLGIKKLLAVAGGSMGGFQVLHWALGFPEMVKSVVLVASGPRTTAQGIAFNIISRDAITADQDWNNGDYYGTPGPVKGLSVARMLGHITYLSEQSMESKFGRRLQFSDSLSYNIDIEFAVESYLRYQGRKFVERFDANSYLYITKAIDYYDIERSFGPLREAFGRAKSKFLLASYSSDWLFPTPQMAEIYDALSANDKDVSFSEIPSPYGHDAFLLEVEQLAEKVTPFLERVYASR